MTFSTAYTLQWVLGLVGLLLLLAIGLTVGLVWFWHRSRVAGAERRAFEVGYEVGYEQALLQVERVVVPQRDAGDGPFLSIAERLQAQRILGQIGL